MSTLLWLFMSTAWAKNPIVIWDLTSVKLTGPNDKGLYTFCASDNIDGKGKLVCKDIPATDDIWIEIKIKNTVVRGLFRRGDKKTN